MEIGTEEEPYIIEPLEDPVPNEEPVEAPEPVKEPEAEPVPAGQVPRAAVITCPRSGAGCVPAGWTTYVPQLGHELEARSRSRRGD